MVPCVLAIFGTINGFELLVVLAAALMVFGSRLPDVALRAVAHVMRARRAVTKMWRDTGLEEELRRVRRDIEMSVPRAADFDVASSSPPPAAVLDHHDDSEDPDAARAEEYYDSSVDIRPAEGIIASGEWSAEEDLDRREPTGEEDPEPEGAGEPSVTNVDVPPGEASSEADVDETADDASRREG
jgi:Sec-independent protein translocase protein TatA